MRTRRRLQFIVFAFLIGISTVSYARDIQKETTPEPPQGFLKVSGKNIVDAKGNVVILRGVNLGGWLVPEGYILKFEVDTTAQELLMN